MAWRNEFAINPQTRRNESHSRYSYGPVVSSSSGGGASTSTTSVLHGNDEMEEAAEALGLWLQTQPWWNESPWLRYTVYTCYGLACAALFYFFWTV